MNGWGNHKNNIHIALYNLTDEQWEYEAETVTTTNTEFNAGAFMEVYNNRVYLNHDRQIYCYDILSGELVWKQNFEGIFFIGGFTIDEGMIVANCEEAFTYGVEPETGEILWKASSGGSTSPIAIMNGVAYFSGGSDGRLNAINIKTGKYIWKLKNPRPDYWKRHVAVMPGDGNRADLIVASTYKEFMAFPATR